MLLAALHAFCCCQRSCCSGWCRCRYCYLAHCCCRGCCCGCAQIVCLAALLHLYPHKHHGCYYSCLCWCSCGCGYYCCCQHSCLPPTSCCCWRPAAPPLVAAHETGCVYWKKWAQTLCPLGERRMHALLLLLLRPAAAASSHLEAGGREWN